MIQMKFFLWNSFDSHLVGLVFGWNMFFGHSIDPPQKELKKKTPSILDHTKHHVFYHFNHIYFYVPLPERPQCPNKTTEITWTYLTLLIVFWNYWLQKKKNISLVTNQTILSKVCLFSEKCKYLHTKKVSSKFICYV